MNHYNSRFSGYIGLQKMLQNVLLGDNINMINGYIKFVHVFCTTVYKKKVQGSYT